MSFNSVSLYQTGRNIDDMPRGVAVQLIYGICRERFGEQQFNDLEAELEMIHLQGSDNPEDLVEAQKRLNAKFGRGG